MRGSYKAWGVLPFSCHGSLWHTDGHFAGGCQPAGRVNVTEPPPHPSCSEGFEFLAAGSTNMLNTRSSASPQRANSC